MIGKVTRWQMTEEQRQAYIKEHPIKPTPKQKRSATIDKIDYKWRGDKGAASRWGEKI